MMIKMIEILSKQLISQGALEICPNWAAARADIRTPGNSTLMQLHENRGGIFLAQLYEGATAKCPDIGRMPGRADWTDF